MRSYRFCLRLLALTAAVAFLLAGCGQTGTQNSVPPVETIETEETPSPEYTEQPELDLQSLIESGEAQTYSLFAQWDDEYDMEAFRTLLPMGWEGQGIVDWNYASALAPARCSLLAKNGEGAYVLRTSDFHYVEQIYSGAYNSTEIASPDGTPLRMQSTSIEMAYEIPISLVKAVTDVNVEGLEDADPDGLVLNAYNQAMSYEFEQAIQSGMPITGVFGGMDAVYGTALIDGVECDFEAYITMCGYTRTSSGSGLTISACYWSVFGATFYFAPKGTLDKYINDMDIINQNYIANANWMGLRGAVRDELFRLLREKQLTDWARAREFSKALYDSMYYNRNRSNSYSSIWDERSDASSYWHQRWEETLTGREAYDIGGGEHIVVDGFYDKFYGDGNGNYIGSNNPGFDPGAGYSELNSLTG